LTEWTDTMLGISRLNTDKFCSNWS
jgi:hypothetical protein